MLSVVSWKRKNMAFNWTEAQIEEVVASVLKNLNTSATVSKNVWDSTQYNGRKLVGIYADMNDAIDAATAGYKAVRAMSLEEREKIISAMKHSTVNEEKNMM